MGQKVSIKTNNVSVRSVFNDLKDQTGTYFMFNEDEISDDLKVNVDLQDVSLEVALDDICEKTNLTYRILEDYVLIKKDVPVIKAKEQKKKIKVTGTILDNKNKPVPGVSVIVKGTTNGAASDIDGNYSIAFENSKATLLFSFVGMVSQEIKYQNQKVIDVTMLEDSQKLADVVVTGYSSISRERATGSFVKIDQEKLNMVQHNTIAEKLVGASPGLLITTVNVDGGNKLVLQIRGKSSLRASNDPLIVIDGFPIAGRLEDINTEDVETINVLQDAAAASIWGARAANGVVVITTKKGSLTDKPIVEFNYNTSVISNIDMDDLEMGSSSDVIDTQIEYYTKGIDTKPMYMTKYGYDYELNPVTRAYMKAENDETYTDAMRDADVNKLREFNVLDQYKDLFLRIGRINKYDLSIRGGKNKHKYFASVSHTGSKSQYKGDGSKNTNITLNNTFGLLKKLTLTTGIYWNQNETEYNGVGLHALAGGNFGTIPVYQKIIDNDGKPVQFYKANWKSEATFRDLESKGLFPTGDNLLDNLRGSDVTRTRRNLRFQAGLKLDITKDLNFETKGMFERNTYQNRNYAAKGSKQAHAFINDYSQIETTDGRHKVIRHIPNGGLLKLNNRESESYTFRNQLNFNKTIDKHQINLLAGFEMREVESFDKNREEAAYDDQTGVWPNLDLATLSKGVPTWRGSGSTYKPANYVKFKKNRYLSQYANMGYTYDNRYTITASARIDDGSMFGVSSKDRKTPLWSIGTSWNVSKEDFFNVSFVDFLKLRATYGENGNVSGSASAFTTIEYSGGAHWTTQEAFSSISNRRNDDLNWETTATTNLAVDFDLLENLVSGTFEYYNKQTTDVLSRFNINPFYGTSGRVFNNGEIRNRGYMVTLNFDVGNEFKWNPSINLTHNKNKVIKSETVSENPKTFLQYVSGTNPEQGYSVSEKFGYKSAGLDENGQPQAYNEVDEIVGIATTITDKAAIHSLGQIAPKYWGSFTNSFSYKNFSLHAMITYKFGHIFKLPIVSNAADYQAIHKSYANRWKEKGDEKKTNIPVLSSYNANAISYYQKSDAVYDKADHIRLQDISLKYNLSDDLLEKIGLTKLQFSLQASNLGIIWAANDGDYDPEYVPFGNQKGITQMGGASAVVSRPGVKPSAVFSFGIKAIF